MFIPDHSLQSFCHCCLFWIIKKWTSSFCLAICWNFKKKRNENYFFQKSIVIKFLTTCLGLEVGILTWKLWLTWFHKRMNQLYPWQTLLTSPVQSHNNPVQDLQSHFHFQSSLFAWKLLCTSSIFQKCTASNKFKNRNTIQQQPST